MYVGCHRGANGAYHRMGAGEIRNFRIREQASTNYEPTDISGSRYDDHLEDWKMYWVEGDFDDLQAGTDACGTARDGGMLVGNYCVSSGGKEKPGIKLFGDNSGCGNQMMNCAGLKEY